MESIKFEMRYGCQICSKGMPLGQLSISEKIGLVCKDCRSDRRSSQDLLEIQRNGYVKSVYDKDSNLLCTVDINPGEVSLKLSHQQKTTFEDKKSLKSLIYLLNEGLDGLPGENKAICKECEDDSGLEMTCKVCGRYCN